MRVFLFLLCSFYFSFSAFAQKGSYSPYKDIHKKLEIDMQENHMIYRLQVSKTEIDEQLRSMKDNYVKDSLKILLLKLMNIEKLNEQNLLSMDIEANHKYYVALLEEFQDSNIQPEKYLYLENQCNLITIRKLRNKLTYSISVFGIILSMIFVFFFYYKRQFMLLDNAVVKEIKLTPQEKLVKNLIEQNHTNKEIASALFISLSTVKTHVSNLYKKYGVKSRAELINA